MVRVQALKIQGLRNIARTELGGFSRFNLFYGSNGAGKTTVLEAVHLLGLGRSFRMTRQKPLIAYDSPEMVVFGEIESVRDAVSSVTPVGVRRGRNGQSEIKFSGQRANSAAELAGLLPLQVLNSETFQLVLGGPGLRRQFVDWGVFHVEQGFLEQWRRLQRSLKQRNSLLRHGKMPHAEMAPWDAELLHCSQIVTSLRQRYFSLWRPVVTAVLGRLWPEAGDDLEFTFFQGWDSGATLAEVLERQANRDRVQGYTTMGPQRADVRISYRGLPVGDVLSRGQLKLLSAAMRLAQASVLDASQGKQCVFLVDDLPSELDADRRVLLCSQLADLRSQVFITSVDAQSMLNSGLNRDELSVFHVEHGAVTNIGQCG